MNVLSHKNAINKADRRAWIKVFDNMQIQIEKHLKKIDRLTLAEFPESTDQEMEAAREEERTRLQSNQDEMALFMEEALYATVRGYRPVLNPHNVKYKNHRSKWVNQDGWFSRDTVDNTVPQYDPTFVTPQFTNLRYQKAMKRKARRNARLRA